MLRMRVSHSLTPTTPQEICVKHQHIVTEVQRRTFILLLRKHNFRARVDLLGRIAERLSPATTFSLLVGLLGWA